MDKTIEQVCALAAQYHAARLVCSARGRAATAMRAAIMISPYGE